MFSNMNHTQDNGFSILWLRRDLRLHDHAPLHAALAAGGKVQPVFVFDTDILQAFPQKDDRRLTFIAEALAQMDAELRKKGGKLLILHGRAEELIPQLAAETGAQAVYCGADYEPATRKRDARVAEALGKQGKTLHSLCDHLVHAPDKVLKGDGTPYLVFTPYSKAWRAKLHRDSFAEKVVALQGRLADVSTKLPNLSLEQSVAPLLQALGYRHNPHPWWKVSEGQEKLKRFLTRKLSGYATMRDYMAEEGTSQISPYLRFGLLSARECLRLAVEQPQHEAWMNELIWREFYAMVLYHFPHSQNLELIEKYRGLRWSESEAHWQAFIESRTGFPVVDAGMRQLHETGWMHNRVRMVVASFLTKDLHIDWRRGEAHFAQWLMDYDMASNVGGWQWAASTGTDAAPYFRIFNPASQSSRFDPKGDYIRRWVPELKALSEKEIHAPKGDMFSTYPRPIVSHDEERKVALAVYKQAGTGGEEF